MKKVIIMFAVVMVFAGFTAKAQTVVTEQSYTRYTPPTPGCVGGDWTCFQQIRITPPPTPPEPAPQNNRLNSSVALTNKIYGTTPLKTNSTTPLNFKSTLIRKMY